jgi:hypothetical protein
VSKPKRTNWKREAANLARCVVFAVKYRKHLSRGGTVMQVGPDKKPRFQAWEENFMDALDRVGYVIDRKKYWAEESGKRRSKR